MPPKKSSKKGKEKTRKQLVREKLEKLGNNTNSFIYRSKLGSEYKKYTTHMNGGEPFTVLCSKSNILVTENRYRNHKTGIMPEEKTFKFDKFVGYWYGFDSSEYTNFHGNSILIQIDSKNQYIMIGASIEQFTTSEPILDYISVVGNSDVPYPVAFTKNYVLFCGDGVTPVAKSNLKTPITPRNAEKLNHEYYTDNPEPALGVIKLAKTIKTG